MTCEHLDGFPCICGSDEPLDEALMIWAKAYAPWSGPIESIKLSDERDKPFGITIQTSTVTITIATSAQQFTRELVLALREEFAKELLKALVFPA